MRYTYIYKTADGVRTEGRFDAQSRDEVFAALRKRGIRPIKVLAADGAKANGEIHGVRKRVVSLFVGVSILVTAVCAAIVMSRIPRDPATNPEVAGFIESTDAALSGLQSSLTDLGLSESDDYGAIARGVDVKPQLDKLRRGESLVERAQADVRRSFDACAKRLSGVAEARAYIETVKKGRMADLELVRNSLLNREFALVLLDDNKGKWRIENGVVRFADATTQKMFDYCRDGIR